jgi:hypothetical protein
LSPSPSSRAFMRLAAGLAGGIRLATVAGREGSLTGGTGDEPGELSRGCGCEGFCCCCGGDVGLFSSFAISKAEFTSRARGASGA